MIGPVLTILFGFIASDVCNLNHIYDPNNGYEYSLSKSTLESYFSGNAFDHRDDYTPEEKSNLQEDIQEICESILVENPVKEKIAVLTAGAPGVGKTTKMKQDLKHKKNIEKKNYAYVCPDNVCLINLKKTYQSEIANCDGSRTERQLLYNKWRPASNAAAHCILANLIRDQYAFYFGTTSSSSQTGHFFQFLKDQGYKIRLLHISAPDQVRWDSIKERDKEFVQTTEKDTIEKKWLIPQRMNDAYLAYADEIEFYFRGGVNQDAILAAKWVREGDGVDAMGTLHIIDHAQYDKVKNIQNEAADMLQRPDLTWEATIEKRSKILDQSHGLYCCFMAKMI